MENKALVRNMKRYLIIFALLSKYSIATAFQNGASVILFTAGKLFRFAFFFFFIYYLVDQTQALKGYTVDQALIFYLTFNVVDSIAQTLYREVYRFRHLVVSGEFNAVLVKPFPALMRVLIGGVDPMDFLISLGYVMLTSHYALNIYHGDYLSFLLYWGFVINALLIATAFHIIVLAFGIITADVDHTILIYRDITSAGRFPLDIYREPLRSVLIFVIPVGIMISTPALALFNSLSVVSAAVGLVIGATSIIIAGVCWSSAVKKYQSWGG